MSIRVEYIYIYKRKQENNRYKNKKNIKIRHIIRIRNRLDGYIQTLHHFYLFYIYV
jgi:hypothetical protein